MDSRQLEIADFLAKAGWQNAARTPLAGDASPRRYDRVIRASDQVSAVLMDAPKEKGEDIGPFLEVGRFLFDNGFSAPEIYAADTSKGLILMEDLGDDLFARVCVSAPDLETTIYGAAVDTLSSLHEIGPPAFLDPYSTDVYNREANLLTEWYLPAIAANPVGVEVQQEYSGLLQSACGAISGDHTCCVLRDYHAENLLWLPERTKNARVGLLDFQDALLGHPAYDLVSLLEDARRDTDADLREAMIARYLARSGVDAEAFLQAYATLGAQRNLKIIGIFARLCRRDAKPAYVDLIPRVWQHLQNDLSHPALADLRHFVNTHVPQPEPSVLAALKGSDG